MYIANTEKQKTVTNGKVLFTKVTDSSGRSDACPVCSMMPLTLSFLSLLPGWPISFWKDVVAMADKGMDLSQKISPKPSLLLTHG